jgi:hypothetical protein
MKHLPFVLFILSSLFIGSCLDNSEEFVPNTQIGDISELLKKVDDQSVTLTINPSEFTEINTQNKEIIVIPANTFRYANNSTIQGNIVLKYNIVKNGTLDIIKNRESKIGEVQQNVFFNIEFEASQGNQKLIIGQDAKGVTLKVPSNTPDNQILPKAYKWSNNNWTEDNKLEIKTSSWNHGTIFGIGYETVLKNTGDFMISMPMSTTNTGLELCLTLPENYSPKNTVAFAIFEEERLSYKLNLENGKFCGKNLPTNAIVKLISLSEQEGKYYLSENKHRLSKSFSISVVPDLKTIEEVNEWLKNF